MRFSRRLTLLATTLLAAGSSAGSAFACDAGTYSYAGMAAGTNAFGVGAVVRPAATGFAVRAGHVAGWVGVGGPGEGPGGSDEWIQIGLSAFPELMGNDVYYEVKTPEGDPTYHRVRANVPGGTSLRVAVLEMRNRVGYWRVWVNGSPASEPVFLRGSHNRWRPVVTAESWDGGSTTCNDYLYTFSHVSIASAPGGGWTRLLANNMAPIVATNSRVMAHRSAGFFAAGGGASALRALTDFGG